MYTNKALTKNKKKKKTKRNVSRSKSPISRILLKAHYNFMKDTNLLDIVNAQEDANLLKIVLQPLL